MEIFAVVESSPVRRRRLKKIPYCIAGTIAAAPPAAPAPALLAALLSEVPVRFAFLKRRSG